MSALALLSDRDLLDAGMRALRGVDNAARLLTVMSIIIHGDGAVWAQDDESSLAGAVEWCADEFALGVDERARVLDAFAKLGVDEAAILAAATEIVRAS